MSRKVGFKELGSPILAMNARMHVIADQKITIDERLLKYDAVYDVIREFTRFLGVLAGNTLDTLSDITDQLSPYFDRRLVVNFLSIFCYTSL
jgi:hypothetical protein